VFQSGSVSIDLEKSGPFGSGGILLEVASRPESVWVVTNIGAKLILTKPACTVRSASSL
jgi:hypothetical protein